MKGFPNKSVTLVGSRVEIPDGPVFESNALARYGKTIYFHPPTINFGDHLKIVILGSPEALKADNPLYGSFQIDDWDVYNY